MAAIDDGNSSPHTQYTFDLDALDNLNGAAGSAPSSPRSTASAHKDFRDGKPEYGIGTDEVDGPTDFTQNMEFWMRGGTLNRASTPPPPRPRPASLLQPTVEEYTGTPTRTHTETNQLDNLQDPESTPQQTSKRPGAVNEHSTAPMTPERTPTPPRPHIIASQTPQPLDNNEVDQLRTQMSELQTHFNAQAKANSSRIAGLEATLNTTRADLTVTRSELAAVSADRERCRTELSRSAEDYAGRLGRVRDEHEAELVAQREAAASQLEEERALAEARARRLQEEVERLRRREDSITTESRQLRCRKEETEARVAELELQLEHATSEPAAQMDDSQIDEGHNSVDSEATVNEPLLNTAHLQARIADLEGRLAATTTTTASHPSLDPGIEAAREQTASAHAALRELREQSTQAAAAASSKIRDLDERVAAAEDDRDEAMAEVTEFKQRWESLRAEHAKELQEMRKRAEEAIERAGAVARKAEKAKDNADNREKETRREVDKLKEACVEAENAAEVARREREEVRMKAESLRAEMLALRADIATVNREVDRRIVEVVRRREIVWRDRVSQIIDERKDLGRALLRAWGREDVGEGVPQQYRYRFVKG